MAISSSLASLHPKNHAASRIFSLRATDAPDGFLYATGRAVVKQILIGVAAAADTPPRHQ